MKYIYTICSLFLFVQMTHAQGIKEIENQQLFKVVLEVNEQNVLARSNEYFRMQAIKVDSNERASNDSDIQDFKSFYYIVIADYKDSPEGKLYKTANLVSPEISVFPDSYKFFKILIKHGVDHEKQLVLFASNEKIYVKKK